MKIGLIYNILLEELKSKSDKGNRYFDMLRTAKFQHYDNPKGELSTFNGGEEDRKRLISKLSKEDKKKYREWIKTPEGLASINLFKEFSTKDLKENKDNYSSFMNKKSYSLRKDELLNKIKNFKDISDEDISLIIEFFGCEGFNDEEDAIEYLKEKIDEYKSFEDPVKLYRIVGVRNKKLINKKDIGEHFTHYKWAINDDMLLSIGYDNWDEDVKAYVITVLAPLSEINVWQTIIQNLSFPYEDEINLNKSNKLKIIDIVPYDKFNL